MIKSKEKLRQPHKATHSLPVGRLASPTHCDELELRLNLILQAQHDGEYNVAKRNTFSSTHFYSPTFPPHFHREVPPLTSRIPPPKSSLSSARAADWYPTVLCVTQPRAVMSFALTLLTFYLFELKVSSNLSINENQSSMSLYKSSFPIL